MDFFFFFSKNLLAWVVEWEVLRLSPHFCYLLDVRLRQLSSFLTHCFFICKTSKIIPPNLPNYKPISRVKLLNKHINYYI